jgi:hypothetical protein
MGISPKIITSDSPLGEIIRLNTRGDEPPKKLKLPRTEAAEWGATDKESADLHRFAKLLSQMKEPQRTLLLGIAERMASRKITRKNVRLKGETDILSENIDGHGRRGIPSWIAGEHFIYAAFSSTWNSPNTFPSVSKK